jgi:hypothetical protein
MSTYGTQKLSKGYHLIRCPKSYNDAKHKLGNIMDTLKSNLVSKLLNGLFTHLFGLKQL